MRKSEVPVASNDGEEDIRAYKRLLAELIERGGLRRQQRGTVLDVVLSLDQPFLGSSELLADYVQLLGLGRLRYRNDFDTADRAWLTDMQGGNQCMSAVDHSES